MRRRRRKKKKFPEALKCQLESSNSWQIKEHLENRLPESLDKTAFETDILKRRTIDYSLLHFAD